jgi:hypothetical protein
MVPGARRAASPMGTLTPTNWPFCKAGPVLGTKFPNRIPIAIARMIHRTRKRSRKPRPRRGGTALYSGSRAIVDDGESFPGSALAVVQNTQRHAPGRGGEDNNMHWYANIWDGKYLDPGREHLSPHPSDPAASPHSRAPHAGLYSYFWWAMLCRCSNCQKGTSSLYCIEGHGESVWTVIII